MEQESSSLGRLISGVASELASVLIMNIQRDFPSFSPNERTFRISEYLRRAKIILQRLAAIARWLSASKIKSQFHKFELIRSNLSQFSQNLNGITDGIFFTHQELFSLRSRQYEIHTSNNLMTFGIYNQLPRSISTGFGSWEFPTSFQSPKSLKNFEDCLNESKESDVLQFKRNLSIYIRSKLALFDPIPTGYGCYSCVKDGMLVLVCPNLYRLFLSLTHLDETAEWRVLKVQLLVSSSECDRSPLSLDLHGLDRALLLSLGARLAREKEEARGLKETDSTNDNSLSPVPLLPVLHRMCLHVSLSAALRLLSLQARDSASSLHCLLSPSPSRPSSSQSLVSVSMSGSFESQYSELPFCSELKLRMWCGLTSRSFQFEALLLLPREHSPKAGDKNEDPNIDREEPRFSFLLLSPLHEQVAALPATQSRLHYLQQTSHILTRPSSPPSSEVRTQESRREEMRAYRQARREGWESHTQGTLSLQQPVWCLDLSLLQGPSSEPTSRMRTGGGGGGGVSFQSLLSRLQERCALIKLVLLEERLRRGARSLLGEKLNEGEGNEFTPRIDLSSLSLHLSFSSSPLSLSILVCALSGRFLVREEGALDPRGLRSLEPGAVRKSIDLFLEEVNGIEGEKQTKAFLSHLHSHPPLSLSSDPPSLDSLHSYLRSEATLFYSNYPTFIPSFSSFPSILSLLALTPFLSSLPSLPDQLLTFSIDPASLLSILSPPSSVPLEPLSPNPSHLLSALLRPLPSLALPLLLRARSLLSSPPSLSSSCLGTCFLLSHYQSSHTPSSNLIKEEETAGLVPLPSPSQSLQSVHPSPSTSSLPSFALFPSSPNSSPSSSSSSFSSSCLIPDLSVYLILSSESSLTFPSLPLSSPSSSFDPPMTPTPPSSSSLSAHILLCRLPPPTSSSLPSLSLPIPISARTLLLPTPSSPLSLSLLLSLIHTAHMWVRSILSPPLSLLPSPDPVSISLSTGCILSLSLLPSSSTSFSLSVSLPSSSSDEGGMEAKKKRKRSQRKEKEKEGLEGEDREGEEEGRDGDENLVLRATLSISSSSSPSSSWLLEDIVHPPPCSSSLCSSSLSSSSPSTLIRYILRHALSSPSLTQPHSPSLSLSSLLPPLSAALCPLSPLLSLLHLLVREEISFLSPSSPDASLLILRPLSTSPPSPSSSPPPPFPSLVCSLCRLSKREEGEAGGVVEREEVLCFVRVFLSSSLPYPILFSSLQRGEGDDAETDCLSLDPSSLTPTSPSLQNFLLSLSQSFQTLNRACTIN